MSRLKQRIRQLERAAGAAGEGLPPIRIEISDPNLAGDATVPVDGWPASSGVEITRVGRPTWEVS